MFLARVIFSLLTMLYVVFVPENVIFEYVLFSAMTLIIYYLFLEVLPLSYILYVLRTTRYDCDSDYLPSALNSFINESYHQSEAIHSLCSKLLSMAETKSSVLMVRMHSNTVPINQSEEYTERYDTLRSRVDTK